VARARKIVAELTGTSKAETIGGGADLKALGRPDAEPSLRKLRDLVDETWRPKLEALLKVLKALPDGGTYKCRIYIPPHDDQVKAAGTKDQTLVRFLRCVRCGNTRVNSDGSQRLEWGAVDYPCAEDLAMQFDPVPDKPPAPGQVLPIPLPKPWAPFHLLLDGKSKPGPRSSDGKQCPVRIEVPTKEYGVLFLLLDLEFQDAGIPPIDAWDWPSK
jgi:hypothetical protein